MDWIQAMLGVLSLIALVAYQKQAETEIRDLKDELNIEREFSHRIENILKRHLDKLLETEKEND